MAGALFSRLKNWVGTEVVTVADLNAEFNNILNNLKAANITGISGNLTEFQTTFNPGGVGTENLPTSIAQEIESLRYLISEITGQSFANWYASPVNSLATLNGLISGIAYLPQNRIVSGRKSAANQPMFLVPNGAAPTVSLKATATNLSTYINNSLVSVIADINLTPLSTAPSSNNTCLVNDVTLTGQQSSKTQGENGTFITIDSVGSAITALNGNYAAFKHSTEYFIAEVDTSNNRLKNAWRGACFDSTDAWKARTAMSDDDTITLMKLAWIFVNNAGALDVTYDKPSVSYQSPSGPSAGDYWLDLSVQQWKKYSGIVWTNQSSVLLGFAICDATNCVAARSVDFYKGFSITNSLELEYVDTANVRSNRLGAKVNAYGSIWAFDYDFVKWNSTAQLESGEALSASTTYWVYVTDLGDRFTSTIAPYDRRFDLLGSYHPAKPWRCVGTYATNGGSLITSASVGYGDYYQFVIPPNYKLNRNKLGAIGQQISTSSGALQTTTSASESDITNLVVTITTYGNPVSLNLQSDGSANSAYVSNNGTGGATDSGFFYDRDGSNIAFYKLGSTSVAVAPITPSMLFIDTPLAGTHTYKVRFTGNGTMGVSIAYCVLVAMELT